MDNVFITQYFDWNRRPTWRVRFVNAILARLGIEARLMAPRLAGDQSTIEQRINLYHLASHILIFAVPGAFVEIGAHHGGSAALLARAIEQFDKNRELHVYDAFMDAARTELIANFDRYKLPPPIVHCGWVRDTLPVQLPEQIAFAHVDVGWGQPSAELLETARHCLASVYPRLAPKGVLVVADYCEPDIYERQRFPFPNTITNRALWNLYPPLKAACDAFFADKPEKMAVLYSGHYSHGYFRKL